MSLPLWTLALLYAVMSTVIIPNADSLLIPLLNVVLV